MRIKITLKHSLEGYDRITIGVDVAPFGLPEIDYKRIYTFGANDLEEAIEKMKIIEKLCYAFWNLNNLEYMRQDN